MTRRPPSYDQDLLDTIQRETLGYFWEFGHPACGMAYDRSIPGEYGPEAIAVGGTGFGIMALLAGVTRGWLSREDVRERLELIVSSLEKAERHHGVFPHFLDGATGRTIPFGPDDDGGDIVETAFLVAGLLCARQFFAGHDAVESGLRERIDALWRAVEWDWYTNRGSETLYWHWSPRTGFARNFPVRGWNECLITYVLAAASPTHPVDPDVYRRCWKGVPTFRNGRRFYGITLPLGPDWGGSLCFTQYSFMGIDPRGLTDEDADYWEQNVAHTLINREHCVRNPNGFSGYGRDCWGLTASDDWQGYRQHAPDNDSGVITPSAALSSFPYAPDFAMEALETFMGRLGERLRTPIGLRDAFCEQRDWVAPASLAIDQGPIVVMIENHRSGLLWDLGMSCPEIQAGLLRLGFRSPRLPGAGG